MMLAMSAIQMINTFQCSAPANRHPFGTWRTPRISHRRRQANRLNEISVNHIADHANETNVVDSVARFLIVAFMRYDCFDGHTEHWIGTQKPNAIDLFRGVVLAQPDAHARNGPHKCN